MTPSNSLGRSVASRTFEDRLLLFASKPLRRTRAARPLPARTARNGQRRPSSARAAPHCAALSSRRRDRLLSRLYGPLISAPVRRPGLCRRGGVNRQGGALRRALGARGSAWRQRPAAAGSGHDVPTTRTAWLHARATKGDNGPNLIGSTR